MQITRQICKEHINSWLRWSCSPKNQGMKKILRPAIFQEKKYPHWRKKGVRPPIGDEKPIIVAFALMILWLLASVPGSPKALASTDQVPGHPHELMEDPLLPLVTLDPGDDCPVYRQKHQGQTVFFLVLETKLALVVSPTVLARAKEDETFHQQLVEPFAPDLLQIWFDDAQHWLHWLENWDDRFFGKPTPFATLKNF